MRPTFITSLLFVLFCSFTYSYPACGPDECDESKPCPELKRCVFNFCRYECFWRPAQDPHCPKKYRAQGYCPDQCNHLDQDSCKSGQICCFTGCGNECCTPETDSDMSRHIETTRSF